MFNFLPATSKQHQVAGALLQWPQNTFLWLKRKGMHQEGSGVVFYPPVGVSGWVMPILGLKLKQEQKQKCKKTPKTNNLKNTEQEGAQEN